MSTLRTREAAGLLGVSDDTVRRWAVASVKATSVVVEIPEQS